MQRKRYITKDVERVAKPSSIFVIPRCPEKIIMIKAINAITTERIPLTGCFSVFVISSSPLCGGIYLYLIEL
jgi:hypothetical protein